MFYLADAAIILGVTIALILASWAASSPQRTLLENTALGVGAGLGFAGCIIALFGAAGHFGLGFAALFILPLGWLARSHRKSLPAIAANARRAARGVLGLRGVDRALFGYIFFVCALSFALTLAPPNGNDYDSLVYHLAAPAQYLRAGHIVELAYDHHSYFPFLTEMLFALGLSWKGPVLAKLFHWLMLPLCCVALTAMGSRHFSLRVGLLAACFFASIPLIPLEATTAYVDLSLCAFVLLAFLSFCNWLALREKNWLFWSGAMCGFALGVKYSGALFFGWLLLWAIGKFFFDQKRTADVSDRLKFSPIASFTIIALLLGGGWYIRNILWTGNPVYPFAYEIFGGTGWTLEMAKAYTRDQNSFGFGRGVLDFLLAPLRVAFAPLNFNQPFWPLSAAPLQNGTSGRFEVAAQIAQSFIGPPLLAFGLPLVFIKRKPQVIGFLLWTFLAMGVFWYGTSQQMRYLLPSLALLCLPCAWGVLRLPARSALLKWTCAVAFTAWLVFVPVHTVWRMRSELPLVAGVDLPEYYLTRTFSGYSAMQWANANTPANARFAAYGEPRCFYLQRDYFWADDAHNNLIDYAQIKSDADFVRALREHGATHVLWNTTPERNGGFGGPPPQMEAAIQSRNLKLLFEARGYRVYEIAGVEVGRGAS